MRLAMSVIVLLASSTTTATAQNSPLWKFKAGKSFTLERVFQQTQTVELAGKAFKQESTTTWETRIDVRKVGMKDILIDLTIASVIVKHAPRAGGKAGPGLLERLAGKLKGNVFHLTLSPAGRIRKFEGYGEVVRKLASGNDELEKTVRFLLPESTLRDGLEEALGVVPDKPVPVGGRWQRDAVESIAPFGSFKTKCEYTYEGRSKEGDAIACTLQSTYVPPKEDLGVLRVVKGKLQAENGKGKIYFDAQRGLLIRGERQVRIHGTLTVETPGNMKKELKFVSEDRLQWRLLEK